MPLTTATGILAMLDEKDPKLKRYALASMNRLMEEYWPEFAESEFIRKVEVFQESKENPNEERQLAALVASKIYYHLNSLEQALQSALGAEAILDLTERSEFIRTILARCIDIYIKQRQESVEHRQGDGPEADPRLEKLVNRLIQQCFDHRQYKQAMGLGIEARRLDVFEKAVTESGDQRGMLGYGMRIAMSLVQHRQFRSDLFSKLVSLYVNVHPPDYINMVQCLIFMERPNEVAEILARLLEKDDQRLMAYQLGFDLYENGTQQLLHSIRLALKDKGTGVVGPVKDAMEKLDTILSGQTTIQLHLQFLIRNNHTDLVILKHTKDAVRNSVNHNAAIVANGFMNCGTTSDVFLRDNLEWLGRATNWAKFSATASLGVIHRGHEKDPLKLMSTYLPKDAGAGSYAEGGGLYALGLIHANHGTEQIVDYLSEQLKAASNEMVRHGGCLGLGLAAMSTARDDIYELLKQNLFQDDAITGEAASVAMGLVMLGSHNAKAVEDMVTYAHETQHEKILRGLAVALALVMFGRLEEADPLITQLMDDKDPIMRRCAMYTIAMAYCGTGNNEAIRKLLHVAVSDTDNDVRRSAVLGIGFLLFRHPEQCPGAVDLLAESYNPHVRYGAALALGIACAGTGSREAISILEPMLNDTVNYVRQGVYIASAMILMQHNEETCPKSKEFREKYRKAIDDKHEDVMARFGAIVAQGIIDAGGRNVTISAQTRTGHTSLPTVVGLFVFTQFWYWFPFTHFLSMAFTPTCLIALNKDLKMPKINLKSAAEPKKFAYPPPAEEKKSHTVEKVQTAVLSITAKQRRKDELKKMSDSGKSDDKMDVDEDKKEEGKADGKDEVTKMEEAPKDHLILQNPARVMNAQLRVMSVADETRYRPLKPISTGGIIMLADTSLEPEEIVESLAPSGPKYEGEEQEPTPPEPFEYVEE
ncbi:26S proteasome non-ATPase regulatory subunit 1-like [Paramacrobiotus metropolitanus]|uniref:26S proteasome non-ATPase regulatory subunit 1-like n=1 Tax=Paramacrobiotus metropolitanus TaxID=2943436 RepID=UPI0024460775|nr:26S proteasome non-ATPase regulatory subunit 1-like [Paramacrobiotus metropolitanus]